MRIRQACVSPLASSELAIAIDGPRHRQQAQVNFGANRLAILRLPELLLPWLLEDFREEVLRAMQDDGVEEVVIRADSPGGLVQGTPETAEVVRRLAKAKPTTVVAEGYLCSGAFWIASQARRIIATPSTIIGSCGVISVLVDSSQAFQAEGLVVHAIATSEAKTLGVDGRAVTEADIETIKRLNSETERLFVLALRHRRTMTDAQRVDAMSAETFHAAEAKTRGLIDEVALAEDAIEKIRSRLLPTHATLRGVEAFDQFAELVCKTAKCEHFDEAPQRHIDAMAASYQALHREASLYSPAMFEN